MDGGKMPKGVPELGALAVKNLTTPGLHAVGGVSGLCLNITPTNSKSWILRTVVCGKRREIGLGPFPEVSLAKAREVAREMKVEVRVGVDPVEERRRSRAALVAAERFGLTFDQAVEHYFAEKKSGELRNVKHAKQWRSTLSQHASPVFGSAPVSDITVHDVLKALKPIWQETTETASRVRGRIEAVLDWAAAAGHREGENPARWKGNLQLMLPSPAKLKQVQGQPAVALDELAGWFAALRQRDGMAARALEFLALTAARSGEIRGATWSEIDEKKRIWTIPASRMKAGREHRVPLSEPAMGLVTSLPRLSGTNLLFPSPRNGQMSDMTLSAVMRRMQEFEIAAGRKGFLDPRSDRPAVPHGLRSSFRDWAAEKTEFPREMAEMALAHFVGSEVERAYRRGDMLERRRAIMGDWGRFLDSG